MKTGSVVAATRQLVAARFLKTRLPPPVIDVHFASKLLVRTVCSWLTASGALQWACGLNLIVMPNLVRSQPPSGSSEAEVEFDLRKRN